MTERPNLLVEVNTKTRTMAKIFKKIWTGGDHINALANHTNILYRKYRNEGCEGKY